MSEWTVERTETFTADLERIFDHLSNTHRAFGHDAAEAFELAEARINAIEDAVDFLATAPHQGTRDDFILPGLRHVTKERAVLYFTIDEGVRQVTVLAVFFGGRDHRLAMLKRMLSG